MFEPDDLLLALRKAQVDFIVIGAHGALDIMQWVAGIDADLAYDELAPQALAVPFRDTRIRVCGMAHLQAMKRTAARPQDLEDLRHLEGA